MSELVVITYPDEYSAAKVLATLRRMRSDDLLDLDDAVSVVKRTTGQVTLHLHEEHTIDGEQRGHFWRRLTSRLFQPERSVVDYENAAGQQFIDIGIDEAYIEELGEHMQPGSSAIMVLVRSVTVDKVAPTVAAYGGTVLRTSLPPEAEAQLRSATATPTDAR
jgi:uncharacterized membrane protein